MISRHQQMPEFEAALYRCIDANGVAIRQCQLCPQTLRRFERVYFKPTDAYFGSEQFA